MYDPSIPRQLQDVVDLELEPGERVEWIGMPKPTFFTPTATRAFLFGILCTAFWLFWTASVARGGMKANQGAGFDVVFLLLGFSFILIELRMLLSPYWAYRKALVTVYVITDRRAITIVSGGTTTIRSYPPEKLHDIFRTEKKDGSGDVVINRCVWHDSDGDRQVEELGFLRVENVLEVERKLKELATKVPHVNDASKRVEAESSPKKKISFRHRSFRLSPESYMVGQRVIPRLRLVHFLVVVIRLLIIILVIALALWLLSLVPFFQNAKKPFTIVALLLSKPADSLGFFLGRKWMLHFEILNELEASDFHPFMKRWPASWLEEVSESQLLS